MDSGNLFERIPIDLHDEIFEKLVHNGNVTVERIVSRGHTSPESGWYDQDTNEWVLVLKGAAVIAFPDGDDVPLGPGDYLDIPTHRRHRVKWTTPDTETIWLAVHY